MGLTVSAQDGSGGRRLRVAGELDADTSLRLREPLLAALHEGPVVLDLTDVDFCDSAGLSVLVAADRTARDTGHPLVVAGACPRVLRVLATTGLHRVLTLDPPLPDGAVGAPWRPTALLERR